MAERYACPHCEKTYAGMPALKTHISRMHGGYTDDEIAAILQAAQPAPTEVPVPVEPGTEEPPPQVVAAVSEPESSPKKMTKYSRELNEHLNLALQLGIKHLTRGLNDMERDNLDSYRREVTAALIGVEFDFDERLIVLRNKIWLAVAVLLLYGVEKLPTFAEMFKMIKEPKKKEPPQPKVDSNVNEA